ncbi:P-loop containing nucleoside triphosphate hydrolase protein [Poronia punctata]|nr:P-loop containing nucleoside triphosphate hydrolase protein [Poronia punctata]
MKRRQPGKLGKKKLMNLKAQLTNQFANIFDLGSRAEHQSRENTEEQRKRDEVQLEEALSCFKPELKVVGAEENCTNHLYQVEGMKTPIRDYQVVGAGFMVRRERTRGGCRGGIIADDMGIGKTVQSIACMVSHRPSRKALQEDRGATLIVVPNQGLIQQWKDELLRHTDIDHEKCLHTHPLLIMYRLVTYSQVQREYNLPNRQKAALFQVEFYRIILDEGDNIKNMRGKTSIACAELKATLKWVLSGTPLRNRIEECIPYFRFLDIDWKENKEQFAAKWGPLESYTGRDRVMQILAQRMLRREIGQTFMGREVCKLPPSHFSDKMLSITNEERIIFRYEEEETEEKEQSEADNDEEGPRSNYYVRVTRERQAVDHPFLLECSLRDLMKKEELEDLIEALQENKQSLSCLTQSKIKTEDEWDTHTPGLKQEPDTPDAAHDIIAFLQDLLTAHGTDGCIQCYRTEGLITLECQDKLCGRCWKQYVDEVASLGKTTSACPRCDRTAVRYNTHHPFERATNRKMRKRSPGDDFNGVQPAMSGWTGRWLRECDNMRQIMKSTKTEATLDQVSTWQKEAPDDKIVVFMEWIATARVLGRMLNEANINFVYYNGGVSVGDRAMNLETFRNEPEVKVMLAGMNAGSVGLNVTVANRVIITTPWWNMAGEFQAFARVKRHGQLKETYLVRLFAWDSIDERIHRLQEKKEAEIKVAMKEGRKPKPLTREEKIYLMGGDKGIDDDESDQSDNDKDGGNQADDEEDDSDASYQD